MSIRASKPNFVETVIERTEADKKEFSLKGFVIKRVDKKTKQMLKLCSGVGGMGAKAQAKKFSYFLNFFLFFFFRFLWQIEVIFK